MNLYSSVVPAACGWPPVEGLFAASAEIRAEDGDAVEIGDVYAVGTRRPVRSTACARARYAFRSGRTGAGPHPLMGREGRGCSELRTVRGYANVWRVRLAGN